MIRALLGLLLLTAPLLAPLLGVLLGALLLSAAEGPGGAGEELERFLARWAGSFEGLETLEVRFRQEKKLKVLLRPLVSQGTIRLRVKDRRLKCTVLDAKGEVESEVLAGESRVEIHYPSLRRLEVYDLGAGAAPPVSFPGLGGDVATLKRDHVIKLEREGRLDRLVLIPRSPSAAIRETRLLFEDFQPRELHQLDRSGAWVRLEILEFRRNAPLKQGDLDLQVPPGTEVVRPLRPDAPASR